MAASVKEEPAFLEPIVRKREPHTPADVIDLSSSSDGSDWDDEGGDAEVGSKRKISGEDEEDWGGSKRIKTEDGAEVHLPLGFLDPLPREEPVLPLSGPPPLQSGSAEVPAMKRCRQFWKAGDYEGTVISPQSASVSAGMDHVRVHPKFLHSNATSHKWALGAFAELMDNALDEICNGATFIKVDVLVNKKDGSKMLLFEDNGGGMYPEKMRQCMSLGYSVKSKLANTIGQYGNGFKTSTMRLGADVIVFSRCRGKNGTSATQSIGLLSYTFLSCTGKEDIVVPMLDYEKGGSGWNKVMRSSLADWNNNLETIMRWSPYSSEADLLQQFQSFADQGTRIVIFNLWEDDQGALELDFNTNKEDIQLGGVNRDEKKIEMAAKFPNSRHFLTYQHSLRSYASILYLRLPANFRIILRGKEVEHHNIVDDMMKVQEVTYKPQHVDSDRSMKEVNLVAVVTIGFVKDAKNHLDVQGFNVYHKNRLIKPFWRVWNAAGSDGRGVIGVLEANFIEPAHDKQGFERTIVLSRLEARLVQMQKQYWTRNCQVIGYAPRVNKKFYNGCQDRDSSPEECAHSTPRHGGKDATSRKPDSAKFCRSDKYSQLSKCNGKSSDGKFGRSHTSQSRLYEQSVSGGESDSDADHIPASKSDLKDPNPKGEKDTDYSSFNQLKAENLELRERIKKIEDSMSSDLRVERDRNKSLQEKLKAAEEKLEEANKEQEALIDIFSEERCRRDREEEALRKKLKEASVTIQELLQKLSCRSGPEC